MLGGLERKVAKDSTITKEGRPLPNVSLPCLYNVTISNLLSKAVPILNLGSETKIVSEDL